MPIKTKPTAAIEHYLERYAEPEARAITAHIPKEIIVQRIAQQENNDNTNAPHGYQHCLIIPAYNEQSDFVTRLANSEDSPVTDLEPTLLIVVINQPEHDDDTSRNQQLWDSIRQQGRILAQHDTFLWLRHTQNTSIDIILVQRFDKKIPSKQGVGLARKIGCDIACQMIKEGLLHSLWLHTTDADTHLPSTYFTSINTHTNNNPIENNTGISAFIYPYQHKNNNDTSLLNATQYYEQALTYYVDGLRHARSPYAYHTLGSCIASNAIYYCQARGFPKKSGGEDFYLLNKLTKLGNIIQLEKPVLMIDARLSERVPFGTGPAVQKILAMASPETEYYYYHPSCFTSLKQLLQNFLTIFSYKTKNRKDFSHYEPWLKKLDPELQNAIKKIKIEKLFRISTSKYRHKSNACVTATIGLTRLKH